jgi:hypothetical protein
MRRNTLLAAGLVFLGAALTGPGRASAQQVHVLQPGTWTGALTPPGAAAVRLTFDVNVSQDTTSVSMGVPERGDTLSLDEVRVHEGKLTFGFALGSQTVACELVEAEDRTWAGTCTDGSAAPARIVMVPPGTRSGEQTP